MAQWLRMQCSRQVGFLAPMSGGLQLPVTSYALELETVIINVSCEGLSLHGGNQLDHRFSVALSS